MTRYSCLPHFIIGGVPKAGTTSLYKYLLEHPDVLPAADKERTFRVRLLLAHLSPRSPHISP